MENPPKQISQDGPFSNETASTMMPSQAKQEAAAFRRGFDGSLAGRDFVLLVTNRPLPRFGIVIGLDSHRMRAKRQ